MIIYQARLNSDGRNPSAINAPEQNRSIRYLCQSITENVYLSNASADSRPINKQQKPPHEFEYVSEEEYMPVRLELEELIRRLQNEVRNSLTFRWKYVGSSSRDMITRDKKGNCGYDFDVDIILNSSELREDKIMSIFRNGLNRLVRPFGYDYPENSTRVLTIKVKDRAHSRILYSCDFAIKRDFPEGRKYIHFNKEQNKYSWQKMQKKSIRKKEEALWRYGCWGKVIEKYLDYKNSLENAQLKSMSIYRKTINDVYNEYVLQRK